MKTQFLAKSATALLVVLASVSASAGSPEYIEIVRSKAVIPVTLNLNEKTVRCLVGDYGKSSLKISVPELRMQTAFRQTTWGETEPCINAGPCKTGFGPNDEGLDPSMILDPNKPTENVKITVELKEAFQLDHDHRTCSRSLRETLSTKVRGLDFQHADGTSLGELDYDLCLKLAEKN